MKKNTFDLKNKNIILTGGCGFLGSQIAGALLNEKANVYIIDITVPKKKKSAKYFRAINEIPTIILILIVFIVIFKPI